MTCNLCAHCCACRPALTCRRVRLTLVIAALRSRLSYSFAILIIITLLFEIFLFPYETQCTVSPSLHRHLVNILNQSPERPVTISQTRPHPPTYAAFYQVTQSPVASISEDFQVVKPQFRSATIHQLAALFSVLQVAHQKWL